VIGHHLVPDPAQDRALARRVEIPRPRVAEPDCRHEVERRGFRSHVRRAKAHQDLFGCRLRVHDLHVEEAVVIEGPGVEQLVLGHAAIAPSVLGNEVSVGEGPLRVEICRSQQR